MLFNLGLIAVLVPLFIQFLDFGPPIFKSAILVPQFF